MKIGRKLVNKTLLFIALFMTVLLAKHIIVQYNEYQKQKKVYELWIKINKAKSEISLEKE
nr:MAG: hypothetical protein [Bacteriophage sp.]